jgi:hypothetical protein
LVGLQAVIPIAVKAMIVISNKKPILSILICCAYIVTIKNYPNELFGNCLCGSKIWDVKCMFEENEISMYFLDMHCASCGSPATAPTPELDCE